MLSAGRITKNILIVTQNFLFGGLETQITGQVHELAKKGWNIHLAVHHTSGNALTSLEPKASFTKDIQLSDITPSEDELANSVEIIKKLIQKHDINVVHAHPFGSILPAYIACCEEQVPMVLTLHSPYSISSADIDSRYTRLLEEIAKDVTLIAVSSEVSKAAETILKVTPTLLPNAVSESSNKAVRNICDPRNAVWLLGSRIDNYKTAGIKHFIVLAHEIGIKQIDIAGQGDFFNSLQEWCQKRGYNRVQFLGQIDNLERVMHKYDGCAGMGRFFLEAIEAGRPTCLVGYDGVKGFIGSKKEFQQAAIANFSGRNLQTINRLELTRSYDKITKNKVKALQALVRSDFSESNCWSDYEQIIKGAKPPSRVKKLNVGNMNINTEQYWDNRFKGDWDNNGGDKQSLFFINTALDMFPGWLKDLLDSGGKTICDWGCAEGEGTHLLAKRFNNCTVEGVDFARTAIKSAKSRYKLDNLSYLAKDFLISGTKKEYDIVFTSNVLEHFENPWDIFDKISSQAKEVMIMMVPYNEDKNNLLDEHYHSFSVDQFEISRGEWHLVHFQVADTSTMPNTQWGGQQVLAVYMRDKCAKKTGIQLDSTQLLLSFNAELVQQRKDIQVIKQETEGLKHRLHQTTEDNRRQEMLLSARRHKVANQIANGANKVLPPDSFRRKAAAAPKKLLSKSYSRIRRSNQNSLSNIEQTMKLIDESGYFDSTYYMEKYKELQGPDVNPLWHYTVHGGYEKRSPSEKFDAAFYDYKNSKYALKGMHPLVRYINDLSKNREEIGRYTAKQRSLYEEEFTNQLLDKLKKVNNLIVMISMPWDHALKQRPHHLAAHFASMGFGVVYIDISGSNIVSQEVEKNIFLLDDDKRLEVIAKNANKNIYYWDYSTNYSTNQAYIQKLQTYGYKIIYDYIDDIHESISGNVTNAKERFEGLESINPALLIASAVKLKKQLQEGLSGKNVLLCQNAVDLEDFNLSTMQTNNVVPEDMIDIVKSNKPIVGYYGALAPWLDYELINNLTAQEPEKSFVFIGEDYKHSLKDLQQRANVHFLGPKNYNELASYSYLFDCAIIPFQEGDIAKSTSPVKLFEYMAMGVPTVCTKDLKECEGYDYVYMSKNLQDFQSNIDKAIKAKKTKKARNTLVGYAKQNTWKARAELIKEEINKIEKAGKQR